MKRGWNRRGFTLSEEAIWLLAQAVGALLLVALLVGYVDSSIKGGMLAKQFYPGDVGMLLTVAAVSPDNIIVADFVDKFRETEFTFTGVDGRIDVAANTLKGPTRFWVFTPLGVSYVPFNIAPATGMVHAVKEGDQVTLRKSTDFKATMLPCPSVLSADANGLAQRHVIDIPADGRVQNGVDATSVLTDIGQRLVAILGSTSALSKGSVDDRKAVIGAKGTVISLRVDPVIDDKTRLVAYYNPHAPIDVQLRSQKLGCRIINSLQRSTLGGLIDGAAISPSPSTLLPADRPGVELVIGQLGAQKQLLADPTTMTKAIYDGVVSYYG